MSTERPSELSTLSRLVHELEAPLISIEAQLRVLTGAAPCQEAALGCLSEVRALRKLVADLVPLAREDFERTSFPLAPILERLLARFSPIAGARRVSLDLEIDDGTLSATGDPRATEQILANLIDNAVKFTRANGEVRLRAHSESSGRTRVEVTDQGPGLTEDESRRVFEPFYRSRPEAPGFGLGLAIAKRFAECQNGVVEARPAPGRDGGSTFALVLDA